MGKIKQKLRLFKTNISRKRIVKQHLRSIKECLYMVIELEDYQDDPDNLRLFIDLFDCDIQSLNKEFLDKYR